MEATDIIDTLTDYVRHRYNNKDSHCVLHKKKFINTFSKSYKTYEYHVWYIDKTHQEELIALSHTEKVISDEDKIHAITHINKQLLSKVFHLLQDNRLDKIIYGRECNSTNKQISDSCNKGTP